MEEEEILIDQMNCTVGFVSYTFMGVSLFGLGSMGQGSRAGTSVELNSSETSLYISFCLLVLCRS